MKRERETYIYVFIYLFIHLFIYLFFLCVIYNSKMKLVNILKANCLL